MQTERDYLVSLGLAKPGRGRFSNEAKQALAKARSEGMTFKGAPVPRVEPSEAVSTVEAPSTRTGPMDAVTNPYGQAFIRYSEGTTFTGTDSLGTKHTVDHRQACDCGYSLLGHVCDSPTALVSTKAGIERIAVMPNGG